MIEAVFYALAEAKLPIMSMQYSEKSLEDIFLELTEDVKPKEVTRKSLFTGRNRTKKHVQEETQAVSATDAQKDSPMDGEADKSAVETQEEEQ